jgi:cytochrome c1
MITIRHLCLLSAAALSLTACTGGKIARAYEVPTGGAAVRGKTAIVAKNCGSCHTIPGIEGAHGVVGPPLYFFARRTYIAGEAPNTPDNLVRWIKSPQSIEPHTAMPDLGVTEQQARDIAAYLYTIR